MARYQVKLDSPLGERRGILDLCETDGRVAGTLTLLGVDNPVSGSREGAVLLLRHTLHTSLNALECTTRLREEYDTVRGIVRVGVVNMPLQGTKIAEETEKEHQTHGTADRP